MLENSKKHLPPRNRGGKEAIMANTVNFEDWAAERAAIAEATFTEEMQTRGLLTEKAEISSTLRVRRNILVVTSTISAEVPLMYRKSEPKPQRRRFGHPRVREAEQDYVMRTALSPVRSGETEFEIPNDFFIRDDRASAVHEAFSGHQYCTEAEVLYTLGGGRVSSESFKRSDKPGEVEVTCITCGWCVMIAVG
jgi:hypothetical protein